MKRSRPTLKSEPAVRRCAIYTRKSTTMGLEMDYNSLDAQHESCTRYISGQVGWTLVETRYDDGGFTGANTDRPAFQRMMTDVDAGKIDVIVVYKVDRLSRSLLDFVKLMERLNASGASFVSVTQNFSTADAMGRLTLNMLISFAEFEREMISERTRDKIAGARRRGKWTGGPVPFGYSVKEKKLLINEVEAHVVREAFKLFLEHRQMAAVARLLTEKGLLPRGMAGRPAKGGLRWRKEAIARLLRSPLYVGQMMYGEELHAGEHARLIDDATFELAQRILAGKEGTFRQTGINPDYVLRGLLRCKRCNTQMCPGSTKKGKRAYRYYRCATRDKHGPKACPARPIPAEALEDFVAERIGAAVAQPGFVARLERSFRAQATSRKAALQQVLAGLPTQIARFAAQVNALTEQAQRRSGHARDLVEAKLGVEAERLLAAEKQLAQTECEFKALSAVETESAWVTSSLRDFTTLWGAMLPENRGRLLRALVAEVRVDEAENLLEVELLNLTGTALMGTAENAA